MNRQMWAALTALSPDPLPVREIARKAHLSEEEAINALEQLAAHSIAIREEDGYELSGPLSWFGSFEAAVRYHAGKRFVVSVPGDAQRHLYVDEVRVKGGAKMGDPANQTVAVFACGRTSREVHPAFAEDAPTCEACRSAFT